MNIVTYSLSKSDELCSDIYYNKIADFSDEVLYKANEEITTIVEGCNLHEEGILELLILGVYLRKYYSRALKIKKIHHKLLTGIISIKKKNIKLKSMMDNLKGIMSTLFLSEEEDKESINPILNLRRLNKLILWLEASGEFSKEVKRLKKWEKYLNTLQVKDSLKVLKSAYNFGTWFENRSIEVLGEYTSKVEGYLDNIKNDKWREDILLRKRKRVEYHLNMVGAELMNRAFRQDFINTKNKVLLLPACMTSPSKVACLSEDFGKDFKCKSCSRKCQVNKLTKMGEKYGFRVMVIPHESSISSYRNKEVLFKESTGVVGVACVLNLISGGWLLKDMGVPAQCVLLDYCGCKKHWHNKGIPTYINLNKLKEILDI